MIENLDQLIKARDVQLGGKMLEETKSNKEELTQVIKLLFGYMKESFEKIDFNINILKSQQEEILKKLEDK